jgi:hypothetical protein
MTIVAVQDIEGGNREVYDKIVEQVNVEQDPPKGLIVHTAGPTESGYRIVDVWESAEAMQRFTEERLMPGVAASVGQLPSEPQTTVSPVHHLLKP